MNTRYTGFLLVSCLLVVLGAGCVSSEVSRTSPGDEVTLTVARAGEDVTIQWLSAKGRAYTVLYAEKLSGAAQWRPLPSATNISGTGDIITIEDSVPDTRQRYYRLHIGVLPTATR